MRAIGGCFTQLNFFRLEVVVGGGLCHLSPCFGKNIFYEAGIRISFDEVDPKMYNRLYIIKKEDEHHVTDC